MRLIILSLKTKVRSENSLVLKIFYGSYKINHNLLDYD